MHEERHKRYYRKNRESIIAKRMEKYYRFKQIWYEGVECYMCGSHHNIHYHHLDPDKKEFGIAKAWSSGKTDEEIQKEIDKCIPLCGNCHKIVHMIVGYHHKQYT